MTAAVLAACGLRKVHGAGVAAVAAVRDVEPHAGVRGAAMPAGPYLRAE